MKKALALVLALVLCVAAVACTKTVTTSSSTTTTTVTTADGTTTTTTTTTSSGTHRVACILSGPISDMSWNYTAYLGLQKIEALGAEIAYQENVENSALPDCIATYANDGYDMIILSTNSYQDAALQITPDYPECTFVIINGDYTADNVISYQVADEDQGFLMGALCALMTKTGKVGFVGAMEITPILNGRAGFLQGAAYVNADIDAQAVMTGSFTDVAAAKETALAMIQGGVDCIAPMCDDAALGVDEAAEEGGIVAVASGEGQETVGPHSVITAIIKDTSMIYENAYLDYLAGTIGQNGVTKLGAAQGAVYIGDWYDCGIEVSDEVKAELASIYDKLVSGEIVINLD